MHPCKHEVLIGAFFSASGSAAARLQQAAVQEEMVGPTGSPLDNSSPIPSPDYDAPSPVANEMELELPDEENGAHPPPAATGADSLTSRLETMRDSMSKVGQQQNTQQLLTMRLTSG